MNVGCLEKVYPEVGGEGACDMVDDFERSRGCNDVGKEGGNVVVDGVGSDDLDCAVEMIEGKRGHDGDEGCEGAMEVRGMTCNDGISEREDDRGVFCEVAG
jgi:hypothetical protein